MQYISEDKRCTYDACAGRPDFDTVVGLAAHHYAAHGLKGEGGVESDESKVDMDIETEESKADEAVTIERTATIIEACFLFGIISAEDAHVTFLTPREARNVCKHPGMKLFLSTMTHAR